MSRDVLRPILDWLAGPTAESLGWSLVHFLWQGAAVGLILGAALVAMRRAAPGPRYVVACLALALMAACPVATFAWLAPRAASRPAVVLRTDAKFAAPPSAGSRVSPARETAATGPKTSSVLDSPRPVGLRVRTPEPQAPSRPQPSVPSLRPYLPWFVAAWLAGVSLLSGRLCLGWLAVQRLRRRGVRPAVEWDERLRRIAAAVRVTRPVRLLESALVEVPAVIGWLRPVILLPAAGLAGLTPRQLEALLAHELAHVRRHDYLVNLIQSAVETLLFYHPAVWWVSRTIRAEREACCDLIAAEACGGRADYVRTLAALEERREPRARFAVAAKRGPLVDRVRRLTGLPASPAGRFAGWPVAATALGALILLTSAGRRDAHADGPQPKPREQTMAGDWGPESGGIRCRLVAVPGDTDDESPDVTKKAESFAGAEAVAFAVELKNVSDKPVTLLGVRYGESYPTAAGKLATDFFGPHLFSLEFTDKEGKPVSRPGRSYIGGMLELSGASAHELPPGATLTVLLRPAKFRAPMDYRLPPGEYAARVRYHGPSEEALAGLKKHWPDKPQAKAWFGEVTSNRVRFTVAESPNTMKRAELAWGPVNDGLRAAAEFRPRDAAPRDPAGTVPLNTALDVVFHIKNVGDKPVSLVSETWRQDDQVEVTDEAGKTQTLTGTWYSGLPIMVRWTLRPGEVAELHAAGLAVAGSEEEAAKFEHPIGKTFVAAPGRYTFRYTIRLGNIRSENDKGEVVFPTKEDRQGELVTGEAPLVVRARTPEDDARKKADHFVGRIELVGKDGQPAGNGSVSVFPAGGREELETRVAGDAIEIPDCPPKPLSISVRAPGYEEAKFLDVRLKPGETKKLELNPAIPARFRLVTAGGQPVAGAMVRFFNKTSDDAGGGPYPTDGLNGTVWATSSADGTVRLGSLQKVDPYYAKLGDAVYFFYIEPAGPELAGLFVGGVKAGADLGDVVMTPPLEVRGEIRGTPEDFDGFEAEWDQPVEIRAANPAAAFLYAVSQRLETKREGDKLTFRLTDLRPGTLRIIANFGPHPHNVSHTFGRRDPKEGDTVVEIDLKESIPDLVITPEGRKTPAGGGASDRAPAPAEQTQVLERPEFGIEKVHPSQAQSEVWLDLKRRLAASAVKFRRVEVTESGVCRLSLAATPTSDLSHLQGAPLEELDLSNTAVRDLAPLAGMPLRVLDLSGSPVLDLAPLKGMKLTRLQLSSPHVSDLSPLAGAPLEQLVAIGCPIRDLSPLAGAPLAYLDLRRSKVADLSPLAATPLESLQLEDSPVADLSPLRRTPLKTLWLGGIEGLDLAQVRSLPVERLVLAGKGITDLSPLKGMSLSSLTVEGTSVKDLTPLAGMPLKDISLRETPANDLSPLKGMRLTSVSLSAADTDLAPLAGMPLETAYLPAGAKNIEVLRNTATLKWIAMGGKPRPADEFWRDYDAAQAARQ